MNSQSWKTELKTKFSKQNRNCGFSIEHEFLLEAKFQSCHNILEESDMQIEVDVLEKESTKLSYPKLNR
ncbi:MAG: hypothetical protein DLM72_13710 [Candidatus Nitrosopolaris wilkensis]|nr:MAG: hypothetical protein DLM72_13710 [Candidatus Nitrosopolaris wilkensis]